MQLSFDDFTREARRRGPRAFLVLGSGQGSLAARIEDAVSVPFADVPGLPAAHVPGHRGRLTVGRLGGVPVLVSEGRVHYYEGHDPSVVVRTTHLAADLGVRVAVFTNAAGGIRDDLGPGAVLPLSDVMDMQLPGWWREAARPGPFSPRLLERFTRRGLVPGVYAGVSGPSYETPAEIRALRRLGADAVGMSTCLEARAAASRGLEVAAVSLITNRAAGLGGAVNHEEVLEVARASGERLGDLLVEVIAEAG